MCRAFDLVAPNVPTFGRLTGKKLYAGKVSHEPNNAFPRFIRLFAVFLHMAEDDLTDTGVYSPRMSFCGENADFSICAGPVAHAGEEIVVFPVLLHPHESDGFI